MALTQRAKDHPMTENTATVEAPATVTVVKPTTGLVREYLVAKGVRSAQSRAKIGTPEKVAFLHDFPETTRALARLAGTPIGSRGVIAESVFVSVAESL